MPNDTIPLPERLITMYVEGERGTYPIYKDGYTESQMHAHAAAVSAAARDCRTCSLFYDWEERVCTQSNKAPCTNADKYEPLPPVRLWSST